MFEEQDLSVVELILKNLQGTIQMMEGEVSVLVLTEDFLSLWYVRKKHSFSIAREDLGISLV